MTENAIQDRRQVRLRGAYVELNKLLKFENLVMSGGEAKQAIVSGATRVNDVVETRIRRKLVAGDRVVFGSVEIAIEGGDDGV